MALANPSVWKTGKHQKPSYRRAYKHTLLDQPAYKVVELLKLSESLPFEEFTAQFVRRFDSSKTEEDYKFLFRARSQKPKDDFDGFGDSLMELVPDAAYTFKVEHVSYQFMQGVTISDDILEKFLMSQLAKLGEAVFVTREVESARNTCRAMPTIEKKKAMNVASASADGEKISSEIREIKELVLWIYEKFHELEKKAETTATLR